uniref:Globin domain-containing protein n=1 Tax=Leptobrachium leishanense TaxID=445787 RepID=A0A8C5PGY1_9ANUR
MISPFLGQIRLFHLYFSSFENLSKPSGNAIQAHGKKVLGAINNAVHHLDSMIKLHIDPENFRVCILIIFREIFPHTVDDTYCGVVSHSKSKWRMLYFHFRHAKVKHS